MGETPPAADAEQELRALRARAYGPNGDIQDDPAALARLSELESTRIAKEFAPQSADLATDAAGLAAGARPASAADADPALMGASATTIPIGEPTRSLSRRATATTMSRVWLVAGIVIVTLALIWAVDWVLSPSRDATLAPIAEEADSQILNLIASTPILQIDSSSLRGYETYRGLELWSAQDAEGFECLIAIERESDNLIAANCAPPDAGLRLEVGGYPESGEVHYEDGLTSGSVIRFTLSDARIDVFLFPAAASE